MMQTLQALCALDAPSGREEAVRRYIIEQLQNSGLDMQMQVDALGNLLVQVKGRKRPVRRVMFAAHMDEVALMITAITQDGYLRFEPIGGIDPQVLFGARVRIGAVRGVIGGKAVHQCSAKERQSIPEQLLIDIGAADKKQAEQMVSVADTAVFDTPQAMLGSGLLRSRAVDDRAGCALLLHLLKEQPEYDISVAFTVQEEVGLRGAGCAAFALQPDIAVALDATTAADTAGVEPHKQVCRIGGGPVVSFMDRRTLYDAKLYQYIRALASDAGIPSQTKQVIAGGNDAGAMQGAGKGARVAAVSLPCRYIHSPSCVVSAQDMENTLALLRRMALHLPMEKQL